MPSFDCVVTTIEREIQDHPDLLLKKAAMQVGKQQSGRRQQMSSNGKNASKLLYLAICACAGTS